MSGPHKQLQARREQETLPVRHYTLFERVREIPSRSALRHLEREREGLKSITSHDRVARIFLYLTQ